MNWNGCYYVTIITPNGRVRRQSARCKLPGRCIIAAVDNGMQSRDEYRDMVSRIRADVKVGKYPFTPLESTR